MSRQFNDHEVEILILALRYWRGQRGQVTRRTDPIFGSEEIEILLSKLRGSVGPDPAEALVSSTHVDPR